MVWSQLSINKPHLVYIILGGFTSIFMLVSLFIKEKLYIGEATVATICGLIFGPHAANLINPLTWGNTDQITLEFSRIVLVVQCFAVGVELPKAYMERHWLSVVLLLVPVMTFGWLITSLFIWWMIDPLSWLESLCAAACVTATDPVLASSVVGKGKFAKRVPKHIRDLLSAESGCNDGMAFPFIYLALYLIHYNLDAKHVVQHWICNTILYECIWGAVYGVLVGYIARQAIKLAERKGIIDRESFLVFYFVLALFCAGSGSMLGMDDLLIGFAAGVGFSNDGWFLEKTEESHVSNVIDLLLNLTYFVYLGTIIPWDQYNSGAHGLEAWRLVVIAIMVIFFRRIPIMLMLKPIIPDIKTWREALFCGHFGPIGVGAIFVAILARAELETGGTTPLAVLPDPSDAEYVLIYTIWPITTFLVISSIVVHGSSIAVFTLGKRINTLTMTLSYTTGNDQSSSWMNRLPRVSSTSKSLGRSFTSDTEDEKDFPPGQLPPVGIPKLQLRRQKEEEYDEPPNRNPIKARAKRRSKKKSSGFGGPISDSAITPQRTASNSEPNLVHQESGSDTLYERSERPSPERVTSDQTTDSQQRDGSSSDEGVIKKSRPRRSIAPDEVVDAEVEAYEEKDNLVVEDEEGNVVTTVDSHGKSKQEKLAIVEEARDKVRKDKSGYYAKHKHQSHPRDEEGEVQQEAAQAVEHPERHLRDHFKSWKGFGFGGGDGENVKKTEKKPERKRGPAHAYQYGNTIIVEDEDGEVIHKYEIPGAEGENRYRDNLKRMSTWVGLGGRQATSSQAAPSNKPTEGEGDSSAAHEKERPAEAGPRTSTEDKPKKRSGGPGLGDDGLRMVISNAEQYGLTGLRKPKQSERRPSMQGMGGGRRLSTQDFIRQMQQLDRESRQNAMDEQGVHEEAQRQIHSAAERPKTDRTGAAQLRKHVSPVAEEPEGYFSPQTSNRGRSGSDAEAVRRYEAARTQSSKSQAEEDDDDDEEEDIPGHDVRSSIARYGKGNMTSAEARRQRHQSASQSQPRIEEDEEEDDPNAETAAERRRRLAALGLGGGDSDSSDDEEPREKRAVQEPGAEGPGSSPIRERRPIETRPPPRERETLAEPPRMRVQWGSDTVGAVRGKGGDDEEAQRGSGQRDSGSSLGKKFKGFLNK